MATIALSYPSRGANPLKTDVFSDLTTWADVRWLDPQIDHPGLVNERIDLYHMARQQPASLRDLGRVCRAGIPTINPYEGVVLLADRFACTRQLAEIGIRVPESQYGRATEIELEPPVIVKSRYEIGSGDHEILRFDDDPDFTGQQFVQKYVPHTREIKLHCASEAVRAVAIDPTHDRCRECAVTPQLRSIAERIRQLTGMELFEVDLVGDDALFVVDVNPAISLRGVADGKAVYETLLSQPLRDRSVEGPLTHASS